MFQFIQLICEAVLGYLKADWPILLFGILIAVVINVYGDPEKIRSYFSRKSGLSIPAAVGFGSLTPLCACGTMGVIISMFVSALPWGPVMAFLVSSPLTSPSEFIFEGAFLGWNFAAGMLIASLIMGVGSGFGAAWLENHTGFFNNQFRLLTTSVHKENPAAPSEISGSCCNETPSAHSRPLPLPMVSDQSPSLCCDSGGAAALVSDGFSTDWIRTWKVDRFIKEFWELGIRKILLYFVLFIAIGRVVEMLIPATLISDLFGSQSSVSIPLAATIGLPLYLNYTSAMPLLRTFMESGASQGAILAFLIAGKATGVPIIMGMSAFIRGRALAYYVLFVYVGAILSGYVYELLLRIFG